MGYTCPVMRRLILSLLVFLPLLVACRGRAAVNPTPFPTPAGTASPTASGPIALTAAELANAPGLYLDAVVQVTGVFRKQPLLVCETDPFYSPASWGLGEEGLLVLAGGYDQQVRSLLPEGLLVTAEGRWQRWSGLVGCGKGAVNREVWYLSVARILSPSPLTQVTLTPGGPGTAVAEAPPLESDATPVPTDEENVLPSPFPEETQTVPATSPFDDFATPTLETFATATLPTATATTALEDLVATPTLSGEGTPDASGTPTVTGTPATGTPTVTGTPPTMTPTTPSGGGSIITKGDLRDLDEEFGTAMLAAGTTDRWDMEIFEEEEFTVYVVAPPPADIVVSLLKDGETVVDRQNTAAPGMPEIVTAPASATEGIYEVLVSVAGGAATDYAVMVNTEPEFPVTFGGIVAPSSPRIGVQLPADTAQYWFFTAAAGDELTLTLDPSSGDIYFDFYGPGPEYLDSVDVGFEGEAETLEMTLEMTGLYAISVYEIDGVAISFDLSITLD